MKISRIFLLGCLLTISNAAFSQVYNFFQNPWGPVQTWNGTNTFSPTSGTGIVVNGVAGATALSVVGVNPAAVATFTGTVSPFITITDGTINVVAQVAQGISSGKFGTLTNNNTVFVANNVVGLTMTPAGAVLIPNIASSSAATTGTVCWTTSTGNLTVDTTAACLTSTKKVKKNISPLYDGLAEVMQLHPVSYELKKENNPEHLGRQVGLIAEDVQTVDSRLVAVDSNGDPKGVRYMQITAVLIKAIQEQQREIDSLRRQHHK